MVDLADTFRGCIYGLAIGDALGHPVEFLSLKEIYQEFGEHGIQNFEAGQHPPGTFTDDTQMALAVARAIIQANNPKNTDEIMAIMAQEFVAWSQSPENNRAPGTSCLSACYNLWKQKSWRASGSHSKGCGCTMRVAPIGLAYYNDLPQLIELSIASSHITHAHRTSFAATTVMAYLVALAVQKIPVTEYHDRILDIVTKVPEAAHNLLQVPVERLNTDECTDKIQKVFEVLSQEPQQALSVLGEGWIAEEALAAAMYCFLKCPEDYQQTVLMASNTEGDSDSIACMAGAISGAFNGEQKIPDGWRKNIEKSQYLGEIADRLKNIVV